jgi:hypothetical protein
MAGRLSNLREQTVITALGSASLPTVDGAVAGIFECGLTFILALMQSAGPQHRPKRILLSRAERNHRYDLAAMPCWSLSLSMQASELYRPDLASPVNRLAG